MNEELQERMKRQNELVAQFPLPLERAKKLTEEEKKFCSHLEKEWSWVTRMPERPSGREMADIYLGRKACIVCDGGRRIRGVEMGEVTGMLRVAYRHCYCVSETLIQQLVTANVPKLYREVDLWTLRPSTKSQLPLETQASEIDFLRDHSDENYMFIGPAGASKTTYCAGLYREAYRKNEEYIMKDCFRNIPAQNRINFVWRVNAEELFVQNQHHKTTTFSENPAPAPDVTPEKIKKAGAHNVRPVLIIEELDKSKYTEPRINFLFSLIDAIDGEEGQRIITSNRTLDRFAAMFEESEIETVRVTAEPMMRRLLRDCNVRDYFTKPKENTKS